MPINIIAIWLMVEKAIIFFISFSPSAEKDAKKVVREPKKRAKRKKKSLNSNKKVKRKNKKIPAVIIVAAWSKADTGVGPSMLDGNQIWNPNWPLLAIAAIVKKAIKWAIKSLLAKSRKEKKDKSKEKFTKRRNDKSVKREKQMLMQQQFHLQRNKELNGKSMAMGRS